MATTDYVKLVKKASEQGMTAQEISSAFSVPLSHVESILGVESKKKRKRERTIQEVQPDSPEETGEEEEEPKSPGFLRRVIRKIARGSSFIGRGVANMTAAALEQNGGHAGRWLGGEIRNRAGIDRTYGFGRREGLGRRSESMVEVVTLIDDATKKILSSVSRADDSFTKAMTGVESAIRTATKTIVAGLDEATKILQRRASARREDAAEEAALERVEDPDGDGVKNDVSVAGVATAAAVGVGAGAAAAAFNPSQAMAAVPPSPPSGSLAPSSSSSQGQDTPGGGSPVWSGGGGGGGGGDSPPARSDKLFSKEKMFEGEHPDYKSAGKFTGADLGSYKKVASKKVGVGEVRKPMFPSNERKNAMAERIRKGLITRGLSPNVADAFVMNFDDESGLNPRVNEKSPTVAGSRGGYGLAQWTGSRRRELESFAAGRDAGDVDTQLDFLMKELHGSENRAFKSITAAPDRNTAAVSILNKFLRPAERYRRARAAKYMRAEQNEGVAPETMARLLDGEVTRTGESPAVPSLLAAESMKPVQSASIVSSGNDMIGQRLRTASVEAEVQKTAPTRERKKSPSSSKEPPTTSEEELEKEPPTTSLDDHFEDYPGLGAKNPRPGLGT